MVIGRWPRAPTPMIPSQMTCPLPEPCRMASGSLGIDGQAAHGVSPCLQDENILRHTKCSRQQGIQAAGTDAEADDKNLQANTDLGRRLLSARMQNHLHFSASLATPAASEAQSYCRVAANLAPLQVLPAIRRQIKQTGKLSIALLLSSTRMPSDLPSRSNYQARATPYCCRRHRPAGPGRSSCREGRR